MVQPKGFVDLNHPRKVCKLQRSLYGLKQVSSSWHKRFDEEIKRFGFDQNLDEPCVYQKASRSNVTFLILCFAMKDLGEVTFILGIKIYKDRSKRLIRLGQNAYMGENPEAELRVDCYCDAGFKIDRDDTKSQIGYFFILNGDADVAMEAVWIRKFISELGIVPTINEPIRMFCNNSSVFHIANEPGV
nr:hypothetical protein [Tanacetum cinerariifolium]